MPKKRTLITSDMIPQKEDIETISRVPSLIRMGIDTSKAIAEYHGQHERHGRFFIKACRILGWLDNSGLTEAGERVASCSDSVRMRLAAEAVLSSQVFRILRRTYGDDILNNPDRAQLAQFLYEHAGLSWSTAIRRSSTLVAWAKFATTYEDAHEKEGESIPREALRIKRPIVIDDHVFDVGLIDKCAKPSVVLVNSLKYGLRHELDKINSMVGKNIMFLLVARKSDYLNFDLVMRSEFPGLRDRVFHVGLGGARKLVDRKFIDSFLSNDSTLLRIASKYTRNAAKRTYANVGES